MNSAVTPSDTDDSSSDCSESSNDEASKSSSTKNSCSSSSESSDGTEEESSILRFPSEWTQQGADANRDLTEQEYIDTTKKWTKQVPIGLGLCPWAMKSLRQGNLRFEVSMNETTPLQVSKRLLEEARRLVALTEIENDDCDSLHTALLICSKVNEWNTSFDVFDTFVNTFWTQVPAADSTMISNHHGDDEPPISDLEQAITLVAFHPKFLRWRGLPTGIDVGTTIQAHKLIGGGFQKSQEVFAATILEAPNQVFGRRKIRVEFKDDGTKHYVPIEWCVFDNNPDLQGPPLADNWMHQSPFPTIHLIRNRDLGRLRARDVSRVKRKNAQRMMKMAL